MFCHGNLAHTGRGNRLCSDTFKQAKQLCKSRVPHRKYIAFQGAIKAEPNHPDEVLPPVTFPRRRLAGPAGSCRCTRPKRQQPPGTTSQRAPPPHTAPGTPRPPAPHNASGIPQSARLGSARLAHLPPGPSLPQNADKAATTHLLPRRGRRRKLKVCPPPSLRPPALSLNRSSCLLQAGRGAPASRVLPPTRGTLRPPRPHIRQGKQTPSASGRRRPPGGSAL